MNVALPTAVNTPMAARPLWRSLLRVAFVTTLIWAIVGVVGAAANYSDLLRRGSSVTFMELLLGWWLASIPLALLSGLGFAAFQRWPQAAAGPKAMTIGFVLVLVVFLPIELVYQAALQLRENGSPISLSSIASMLSAMQKFSWFIDFAVMIGAYAFLLVVASWQQRRARELALQRAETDNLKLRLQLERQTLNSLRAQLEPHFLFNALNAISALVRGADRGIALTGLQRLSELLRYAIAAGERDWVSVADEVKFVGDYLALQQLRYGQRLRLRIEGADDTLDTIDCPPLLLQPLVENALRHDLDCHDGDSDISLRFMSQPTGLEIEISNPVNNQRSPNPGLGLGLRNTRERLQLLYADKASLNTIQEGKRFIVRLQLPRSGE